MSGDDKAQEARATSLREEREWYRWLGTIVLAAAALVISAISVLVAMDANSRSIAAQQKSVEIQSASIQPTFSFESIAPIEPPAVTEQGVLLSEPETMQSVLRWTGYASDVELEGYVFIAAIEQLRTGRWEFVFLPAAWILRSVAGVSDSELRFGGHGSFLLCTDYVTSRAGLVEWPEHAESLSMVEISYIDAAGERHQDLYYSWDSAFRPTSWDLVGDDSQLQTAFGSIQALREAGVGLDVQQFTSDGTQTHSKHELWEHVASQRDLVRERLPEFVFAREDLPSASRWASFDGDPENWQAVRTMCPAT